MNYNFPTWANFLIFDFGEKQQKKEEFAIWTDLKLGPIQIASRSVSRDSDIEE